MPYPIGPCTAPLWRMIHPRHQREPFSGEGARLYGGRWNMKGWPALYLSTDHGTAIAEYHQSMIQPGMLVPYRVAAASVADLTATDAHIEAALSCDWDQIARRDGEVPPSWKLAQDLIAGGAEGAIVPSAQYRGGRNLVLWRWHDARKPGDGAALTLLDPQQALAP
ncbi:RES family NAD+ phosphorylase [Sphingomonas immobilis]|uniref:RES family NAD+ phosphorylase n=1 Tax=Sphingomonas immobilis TaxID=3063997 RepID=A0ABT8ZUN0_9SPHN|nr:RES family NAD+ phosphorylase [Sphingomonas sp. CA1-15]MDO7841285.1 RES family NAD+ phosphorylase [Sphingomonas sp. CA1-15]